MSMQSRGIQTRVGVRAAYQLYAESLRSPDHLRPLHEEAQALIKKALA
jgi:hypothetical protein